MTEKKTTEKAPVFDLAQFDTAAAANKGGRMVLRNPATGDETDIWIELLGMDSEEYRKAQRDNQNRRIRLQQRRRNRLEVTAEDLEEEATDVFVAVTTGWSDTLYVEGRQLPFSRENARMLYTRFPWIREQVDQYIHDRANFLKP